MVSYNSETFQGYSDIFLHFYMEKNHGTVLVVAFSF